MKIHHIIALALIFSTISSNGMDRPKSSKKQKKTETANAIEDSRKQARIHELRIQWWRGEIELATFLHAVGKLTQK